MITKLRCLFSLAASLALCSCYFNSAGVHFREAAYDACVNSADAEIGGHVLSDGDKYYIELPRYQVDKPHKLQYDILKDENSKPQPIKTSGTELVQIPKDFARYLTGKGGPSIPATMQIETNRKKAEADATQQMRIVRRGKPTRLDYRYTSSSAWYLYPLGCTQWLIVDMPVTLVENALFVSLSPLMLMGSKNIEPADMKQARETMKKIADDSDARGYITRKDARTLALCKEYYRLRLKELRDPNYEDKVLDGAPSIKRTQRMAKQLGFSDPTLEPYTPSTHTEKMWHSLQESLNEAASALDDEDGTIGRVGRGGLNATGTALETMGKRWQVR